MNHTKEYPDTVGVFVHVWFDSRKAWVDGTVRVWWDSRNIVTEQGILSGDSVTDKRSLRDPKDTLYLTDSHSLRGL